MILAAVLLLGPTVSWDNRDTPQLMQAMVSGGSSHFGIGFIRATSNTAAPGGFGKLSNANWHPRWRVGDGLNKVPGLQIKRFLTIPDGSFILVWRRNERHEGEGYLGVTRWRFPDGTKVEAVMVYDGKPWLRRTLTLKDGEWDGQEVSLVDDPPEYEPSGHDCMFCHKDTGRHVSQLEGHRKMQKPGHGWYNFARGGGQDVPPRSGMKPLDGGVFSWRPVDSRGRVLPQFRHIVRVVR